MLKEDWTQYGQDMGVGIGINTGFVTVGNVGSEMHRDYTVIGSEVNITARLESLAKAGEILISQRTYSKVREAVTARELVRRLISFVLNFGNLTAPQMVGLMKSQYSNSK